MEFQHLQVLPLHECPKYLNKCCELINDEWPRSRTARMMSLQASCDELPTSLILLKEEKYLLGHCKLTPIPSLPNSCFVETVVICKSMRGKKLGTYLMMQVEKYCKEILKLEMIHLSTKGQENFYAKLGYEVCEPVTIYGSSIPKSFVGICSEIENSVPIQNCLKSDCATAPPPPPMPKPQNIVNNALKSSRTYMFKYLV